MKTTKTQYLLSAVRDALLSLVGYPPVIHGVLTRRLAARRVSSSSFLCMPSSVGA